MVSIFTRDSNIWTILFVMGLTMAAGLIAGKPEDYGMTPVTFKWLQLLATGMVAAGKLGSSPLPHSEYGEAKITPKDRT
jgi:hypothetical protein